MSEVLQFHCPACGISLRVPMAAAGSEGPCPRCGQDIAAPDPRYGFPPRRLSVSGSIHAMMERLTRARSEVSSPPLSLPPVAAPAPAVVTPAAPAPIPAAVETPAPVPAAPAPPPPAPEPEPVAPPVKYPLYDPPPAVEPPPPDEPFHYPWDQLAAAPLPSLPVPQEVPAISPLAEPIFAPEPVPTIPEPPAPEPPAPEPPAPEPPAPEIAEPAIAFSAPPEPEKPAPPVEAPPQRSEIPAPEPIPVVVSVEPSFPARPAAEQVPAVVNRSAPPFSAPPVTVASSIERSVPQIVRVEAPSGRRTILLLSCWITGMASLVAGFAGGYYMGNRFPLERFREPPVSVLPPVEKASPPVAATTPPAKVPEPHPAPQETPPAPAPKPPAETKEPAASPTPPKPSSSPAAGEFASIPVELKQTIDKFLTAPNRSQRIGTVLFPERIRPRMETWYAKHPDGPFPTGTIVYGDEIHNNVSKASCQLFTFLDSRYPSGVPLIAMETPDGWKVDWETFMEFYEDSFGKFTNSPTGTTGRYHLNLRNLSYPTEHFPGSDKLTAFRIDPPLPGRIKYAFVPTGSALHKSLAALVDETSPLSVVLELAIREPVKGSPYIEITSLVAPDWVPR